MPTRPPSRCPGCRTLQTEPGRCPACRGPAWSGGHGSTRAGRKLRDQVLAEEPSCCDCGAPATEAGHIIPRAEGGQYVRANLKGQCRACNLAQLRADRQRAAGGLA